MATMASQTSLRYALNLIAPSHLLALRRKSPIVDIPDIKNAYQYFSDAIRSTAYAKEMAGMMFGEEEEEDVRTNGGNGGMMVDPVA
jgi:RuvB-like protein 2